jgi:aspartokinase-like uncharacterized kinase
MSIPWVVKLGGSFWSAEALPLWLEALAANPVIVVPGGGPFADAVRTAQQRWGLDETLAHRLAISAMAQYGRMLQGLCPRLQAASDPVGLVRWLNQGVSTVWLPDDAVGSDPSLEASWNCTSDSLAAWLAEHLGADRLLLIKSADPPPASGMAELVETGLVDRAFPSMTKRFSRPIWISGPGRHAELGAALARPEAFFTQVLPVLS